MNYSNYIILSLIFLFACSKAEAQCGCGGGAAIGGITPAVGSSNIGLMKEGHFRSYLLYSYTYGNDYYSGDSKGKTGEITEFSSSLFGFSAAYGLNNDFTLESEIFGFIDKTQNFSYFGKISSSGLSHLTLNLKYNIVNLRVSELEWTIGAGGKFPLSKSNDKTPQHLQPSTGAFGLIFHSFLHKGFKSEGLHFILASRMESNFKNNNDYQYGLSIINSLFVTQNVFDYLTAVMEFRSEIRAKDKDNDDYNMNSGNNTLIIAPQIVVQSGDFNIAGFLDYPIYKYYNGT